MVSYVVGLDGSRLAEATLPYAETLARAAGARIVLVQAVPADEEAGPPDLTPVPGGEQVVFEWGSTNAAVRAAEEYLESIAQRLRDAGLTVRIVVKIGDPAEILLAESAEPDVNLLLLGTHGRSGVQRLLYGSVAELVLHHTPVPLLLVPARALGAAHASLPRTIFVPLDGSPLAEAAIPWAIQLAGSLHDEIRLLRVVPPSATMLIAEGATFPIVSTPGIIETEEEVAEKYLQTILERIRASGVAASYSVSFDQPGPAIRRSAESVPATLIVMATHARGGVSEVLLGSVAVDVLRHGRVPVLLVPPSGVAVVESPQSAAPAQT